MLDFLKNASFYAKENPEGLAKFLRALCYPEAIAADISFADLAVANGTTLSAAKALLPTTVPIVANGYPFVANITWGSTTTPTYSATDAATYTLSGTLSNIPAFATNSGTKVATVDIVVAAAPDPAPAAG